MSFLLFLRARLSCTLPRSLYLYLVVTETSKALDIFVFKLGKRSAAKKAA